VKYSSILFTLFLSGMVAGQPSRLKLPADLRNCYFPIKIEQARIFPGQGLEKGMHSTQSWPQELTIGSTYYDSQGTPSSPLGRLAVFSNGTMAAVWNLGYDTLSFSDLGTGYSYYNGIEWTDAPSARVESVATVNPGIVQHLTGEAIVSENILTGNLHLCSRSDFGSGNWMESEIPLPAGATALICPRMISSGLNHAVFHLIALTRPVSFGGVTYHGQDGALLYLRSMNGGQSWDITGTVPLSIDSSNYNGFSPGTYAFAEPYANEIAFVVADPWSDLFLMKSSDNGASWQKTVIWQHPYPQWSGQATDTIYCPDGSVHLAFDDTGKIHVVFGLTRLFSDGSQVFRFPYVGGIAHWTEDMPAWTGGDQLNCLNPDSLEANGNLACSYLLDWNNNGQADFLWNFGDYPFGPISQPQIAFDQYGVGMLIMSSVTEGYNDGVSDYRHIWYRYLWQGQIGNIVFDWNHQLIHTDHECVFPSIGARSPDNLGWPFIYQVDGKPGTAVSGSQGAFTENLINRVDLDYMLPDPIVDIELEPVPAEGGTVEGAGSVFYGSWTTIAAHANPGWEFEKWTSENVVFSTDSVATFQALWNYYLKAHFKLATGQKDVVLERVRIFPNPADDRITLELPVGEIRLPVTVQLRNLTGMRVGEWLWSSCSEMTIDVSLFPNGIYNLGLITGDGRSMSAVLIIRRY
jgi:hypothetical protein